MNLTGINCFILRGSPPSGHLVFPSGLVIGAVSFVCLFVCLFVFCYCYCYLVVWLFSKREGEKEGDKKKKKKKKRKKTSFDRRSILGDPKSC